MRRLLPLILAASLAPIALAGCSHPQPVAYAVPPPPPEFDQVGQRGFHDGFDAARRDMAAGRAPNVQRHPRFRNPPVPPPAWDDYRHGFQAGYDGAFHSGPPPAGE
jgi:hypothetical protein